MAKKVLQNENNEILLCLRFPLLPGSSMRFITKLSKKLQSSLSDKASARLDAPSQVLFELETLPEWNFIESLWEINLIALMIPSGCLLAVF